MWKIKRLLDPQGILNPDVVLSEDPGIHLKNLKPLPAANDIIDKCIECGFCEPVCPSNGLSLSPRQRIVIWRDIQAKKRAGVDTRALEEAYQYQGIDTCAATGLCTLRLLQQQDHGLDIYDPVRFIRSHLFDRLEFIPQSEPVAVHVTCSTQRLGEGLSVARLCWFTKPWKAG